MRRRLLAAAALGGLLVLLSWGWQAYGTADAQTALARLWSLCAAAR